MYGTPAPTRFRAGAARPDDAFAPIESPRGGPGETVGSGRRGGPASGPRRSLRRHLFDVVQKFVDVGTKTRQVEAAVCAAGIVEIRPKLGVEHVAGTTDEPVLVRVLRRNRARLTNGVVRGKSNRSLHEPAGRPVGAFGAPTGVSVRLVAWTIEARRSSSDSFWEPWPTRAYLRTSRSVRTGITSTRPA